MTQPDTEDTEQDEPLALADPDDYHRAQRLKEIHQARQEVHKKLRGFERPKRFDEGKGQRMELAYAVSAYVSELEPLIDDLDADISLPDHWAFDDILQYADALGVHPSGYNPDELPDKLDYSPKRNSMQVFRRCNEILADVKPLIEEDDNNEWEV
jgi:hypothetical protein